MVLVLRMKPGALLHIGLPCSNFVWMSSSVHMRSKEAPLGDMSKPSVVRSNCIFERVVLLIYLALARRVWFFLEQPRSSVIPYMAAMQELLSLCGRGYHCTWWMGSFGHWTIKPSLALGNTPWIPKLQFIGNRWSGDQIANGIDHHAWYTSYVPNLSITLKLVSLIRSRGASSLIPRGTYLASILEGFQMLPST